MLTAQAVTLEGLLEHATASGLKEGVDFTLTEVIRRLAEFESDTRLWDPSAGVAIGAIRKWCESWRIQVRTVPWP